MQMQRMERDKETKVEVLYFESCPNHLPTLERIKEAVQAMGDRAEKVREYLGQDKPR